MIRLSEMIEKLIVNLRPMQELPSGQEYKPFNEESHSIWMAAFHTIKASHLDTFDPAMSIQHKFDGKLRRQKKGTQDFTSLALFRDDVECLLCDLYGDVESDALDSIVWAVFRVVESFTEYVRPDLWKEHHDARNLDYMFGIGLPEGDTLNSSDCRRAMAAKADLIHRVREVNANLTTFSDYTIEFARLFAEQWDCSQECKFGVPSDFI
jgi:superfamily I DNA/RNA helicase